MVAGIKPEFASTLTTATCGLNLIPAAENGQYYILESF